MLKRYASSIAIFNNVSMFLMDINNTVMAPASMTEVTGVLFLMFMSPKTKGISPLVAFSLKIF